MHLQNYIKNIAKLDAEQLKHAIQLSDVAIDNYKVCIKNYSEYKLEKYGDPYLKKLQERHQKFVDRLNELLH